MEKMTDTEILNELEAIIESGAARIMYNADDSGLKDGWGKIPLGFSIRVRACHDYDVSAPTLRECVEKDVAMGKAWINDEIGDEEEQ